MSSSCCAPRAGKTDPTHVAAMSIEPARTTPSVEGMVRLDGGTFLMGSEGGEVNPGDGEGPVREVTLSPFWVSTHAVTNREFADFVADTGYQTGAQRWGWSYVFASFLPEETQRTAQRPAAVPWWCAVEGATWNAPEGPGSDVEDRWDHPVVHVDHGDALAYCTWRGWRLPTEAEWEYAARGGLAGRTFAWGDELTPAGEHQCNIWQGTFPGENSCADGHFGTAPVGSFAPNGFGLYDVAGNVWEWCADWWTIRHPETPPKDPRGPASGSMRVMRGGSYLCHVSYCNRYRVAARTNNDPDSASGNIGFRCARDV